MNLERMAEAFPRGTLIGDRFRIEQIAGVGGMGAVYRAKDELTGSSAALKILIDRSEAGLDRFVRESQVLEQLDHPAIVKHVAHGQTPDGDAWLAMEWLEGEDLQSRLGREGLRVSESLGLAERLADALGAAHARGVVHRDIKPSNVFLPGGRWEDAKILDFGIARPLGAKTALTRTGTIIGTPGYMAPEQLEGRSELDARADVFSLGAVLFECLTGKPAFVGEHVVAVLARLLLEDAPRIDELRSDIPPSVVDLVAQMLSKDRDKRPHDGRAVGRALSALGHSTGAPPAARLVTPTLTGSEQRMLCVVVALVDAPGQTDIEFGATLQSNVSPPVIAALRHVVTSLDARVDEVAGALLVSLTGAHNPGDQAARAARCALAMRAHLPGVPIVIVTGRGESSGRLPVGPVVDRAASLLERVRRTDADREVETPASIWMDDVTRALLDVRFDVLEGATGAELLGEREVGESSRSLLGKATPCVGRERELSAVEGIVEATLSEENAHAVLVTGPPGIGKSRVRYEIVRRLRQRFPELSIWVGRADQIRARSAYFVLGSALRHAASISGNETASVRRDKLEQLASVVRPEECARVAAFLGEIVGEPFPDEATPSLRAARSDAAVMASEVRRAFDDFMDAATKVGPVCFVLEDLHWADTPSVRLMDRALGALRDRPLCVIALARPEVHKEFPRLFGERTVDEIRLGELGRKAAERLVKYALGDQVGPATLAKILDRAAGNAFVLEEMIRAVAERRSNTLPETVLGMVEARLASLSSEQRRALRAASIFGETFWNTGIASLAFSGRDDVAVAVLDELVEREVLKRHSISRFAGELEYSFRHALIREGAHAMLTESDRSLGHKLAAEWLEKFGETDPVVLAEHWEHAGEGARAARHFARAAEQALRAGDFPLAVERTERGLSGEPSDEVRADLHMAAAEALAFSGKLPESRSHAEVVLGLATPGTRVHTLALAGSVSNALMHSGDAGPLIAAIPVLLNAQPTPDARVAFAWALNLAANGLIFSRQLDLARVFLDKLEQLVQSAPEDEVAQAWRNESRAMWAIIVEDDPETALQLCIAGMEAFTRHGYAHHAVYLRVRVTQMLLVLGADDRIDALYERQGSSPPLGGMVATIYEACRVQMLTRRGEARRAIEQSTSDIARSSGLALSVKVQLALACVSAGRFEEARQHLDSVRAIPIINETSKFAIDGAIALGLGDVRAALALAEQAIAAGDGPTPFGPMVTMAYITRARAHKALGDMDAARLAIMAARDWLLARAHKVKDPELRKSFLQRIPEHAQIMEMASAWGV